MNTWQLARDAPGQVYVKVAALHGGFITLPEELFVSDAEPNKKTTVPSLCFLIEHPSQHGGPPHRLVFDLGVKRELGAYVEGMQHHIHKRHPIITFPDTRASLKAAGLDAAVDIDTVVLSHIHWDHIGTPSDYSRAEFVLGSGTMHALKHGVPHYPREMMERDPFPFDRTFELPPVPGSPQSSLGAQKDKTKSWLKWQTVGSSLNAIDFFGDGSLYLIDSPGHILGHTNALLRVGPERWIYLGGDCAHDPRLVTGERDIALYGDGCGGYRSVHSDLPAARKTLSNLRRFLKANEDSVEWVVAHDGRWAEANAHRFLPNHM